MSSKFNTESNSVLLVFSSRKPGTTFEHFKDYYETKHVPLVSRLCLQGVSAPLSYKRHYIERDSSDPSGVAKSFPMGGAQKFGFDCVARVKFQNQEHRDAVMVDFGKNREEIAADEAKFLDPETLQVVFVTDENENIFG